MAILIGDTSDAWTITVTGTIYSGTFSADGGPFSVDKDAGLFVAPGTSMIGLPYTETIFTDPSLNSVSDSAGNFLSTRGGSAFGDGSVGADYAIVTTVNGTSFIQVASGPSIN